jgi:hypothetical protein
MRFKSGNYEVRSGLLGDDGRWANTGWWYIDDGPQTVELDWWSATSPGASDGGLTMWINEVQTETRQGVSNSSLRVDFARLGAVAGIDAGTFGSMYFDAFESRRETYIGPP